VAAATWIDGERGNLWAAVVWARNHVGDLGMTLAVRLAQAGFADINAMRRLLEDMLDRPGETGLIRSIAQILVATFANRQGDYDSALRMTEAAAVLARERGDVEALAFALLRAGNVHHLGGDLVRAGMIYDDAIAGLSRSSNRRLITLIRNNVALLAAENGRYAAAREILIECVATARAEGEVERVANYLDSLAWTQLGLDDHNAAEVSWKESLSAYSSIRSRFGTIACLEGLSCAASASGDDKRALRLAAVAERLADEWSYSPLPWMHGQAQEFQRRSLSRIGKRKGQEAQKEGLAMNVASALVYALGGREDHVALDTGPDS
jgi:tetratricopeptide (TPR) repeat protein